MAYYVVDRMVAGWDVRSIDGLVDRLVGMKGYEEAAKSAVSKAASLVDSSVVQ